MADDMSCPQSDHISEERDRLRKASQKHFAQAGQDRDVGKLDRKSGVGGTVGKGAGEESRDDDGAYGR